MTPPQKAQRIAVHAFLGLVAIQFFLAGLGTFRKNPDSGKKIVESSTFDPHRIVGDVISLVAIVILVLAIVTRRELRLSIGLFVAMIVQNVLAGLGADTAVFGALHALNGVLILAVAAIMLVRMRPETAATPVRV